MLYYIRYAMWYQVVCFFRKSTTDSLVAISGGTAGVVQLRYTVCDLTLYNLSLHIFTFI